MIEVDRSLSLVDSSRLSCIQSQFSRWNHLLEEHPLLKSLKWLSDRNFCQSILKNIEKISKISTHLLPLHRPHRPILAFLSEVLRLPTLISFIIEIFFNIFEIFSRFFKRECLPCSRHVVLFFLINSIEM